MLLQLSTAWLLASLSAADDWPQWRGPERDGRWREEGIVRELPDVLPRVWAVAISSGYSAPTVAAGRVYVADRVEDEGIERALAFDAATGEPLWTQRWPADYAGLSYAGGPRAPVQVLGGRAVALGAVGALRVLDPATGELLWAVDLRERYGPELAEWGTAPAPVLEGELLIVPTGRVPSEEHASDAAVVAFDLETGEEVWRALPDRPNFSAPIVVEQAGRRVFVLWTGDRVVGLAPESGELLWEYGFTPKNRPMSIATPVAANGKLFLTAFYDGCALLELDAQSATVRELWRRRGPNERTTDGLHSLIATPVLRGDHLYGLDSFGELRCLSLADGRRLWEDDRVVPRVRWATVHMVERGEDVWILNDRGDLILGRLTPAGFREIDRGHLLDPTQEQLARRGGVVWSHPAFANRCVYARSDSELVCARLAAP